MKKESQQKKKIVISILAALMVLVIGIAYEMSDLYVSGAWKYKITIAIDTPEGVKTGSTVREVSNSVSSFGIDLPDVGNPAKVRGEAVVIDLGERGLVFGLISDRSDDELYEAFPIEGASTASGIKHFNSLPIGSKSKITKNRPTLVRFKDITDPKTLERLVYGDLSDAFGDNVKTLDVTIEITDEPVTQGIEQYLPETFSSVITEGWRNLSLDERKRLLGLIGFKRGEEK